MKKLLLIIVLNLLAINVMNAYNLGRQWSDGALSWSDFQGIKHNNSPVMFSYSINCKLAKVKVSKDTVFYGVQAFCNMDKENSWVVDEYKTDQNLRFYQLIFDIVELNKREFQEQVYNYKTRYDLDNKLVYVLRHCYQQINELQKTTNQGKDTSELRKRENNMPGLLAAMKTKDLPKFVDKNWFMSGHMGLGYGLYSGSIAEHFNPFFSWNMGFEFGYKNTNLYLNGTIGWGKVSKEYKGLSNWEKNQKVGHALLEVGLGQTVFENSICKITPFVGLGLIEISEDPSTKDNNNTMNAYNLFLGIYGDFKFKKIITFAYHPLFGYHEKSTLAIRSRLYVSKANFYEDLKGYAINLGVGISLTSNKIELN